MRAKLLVVLCLSTLLIVALAFAQGTRLTAKIPFGFIVEGKTLPAGSYEFIPSDDGLTMRVVATIGKREAMIASVMTRLGAGIHTSKQDAHIVFDEVGGVYTLSEIWPLTEDGYLMYATKGKHQHRTVDVPR